MIAIFMMMHIQYFVAAAVVDLTYMHAWSQFEWEYVP